VKWRTDIVAAGVGDVEIWGVLLGGDQNEEVTLLFRETHRAFSVSPPISRRPPARTPFPLLAQLEPAFRETTDSDVHWDWLEAAFSSV
jgi:hypothetical protein